MTDSTGLKNLYKHLIENRKDEIRNWHDGYKNFLDDVDKIREDIKLGKSLSPTEDRDFLKKLIYEDRIASSGQSNLSKEDFEKLIEDENFISALEQFIKVSGKENSKEKDLQQKEKFDDFAKAWSGHRNSNNKRSNPLRINRVAAACTLDVSATVDDDKFKRVFNWLIDKGYIEKYPEGQSDDWYSKNLHLMKQFTGVFNDKLDNNDTDNFYLSMFVWELYLYLSNPFILKKQVVKYGPPGTGKTYQARQQTEHRFDIWKDEFVGKDSYFTHEGQIETIQFHPSFSYEDFMEGLRPVPDNKGGVQLKLQNGVFKEFCRKAGKWEIDFYQLCKDHKLDDLEWESITIGALSKYEKELVEKGDHWGFIFKISDISKVCDVVPPFFFIIDEINRAELSRVFGELMYCLEYRGVKGKIKTQYANLNDDDTGMLKTDQGYFFFTPTNIYLIGTMNTIDRSVESFDFALRRRFHWEKVKPDTNLLKRHLREEWNRLAENLERLNEKIASEALLGPDYQIGHAYLMNLKYDKSLSVKEVKERVWDDSIRPLLQEYLRGTGKEAELIKSFKTEFVV